MNTVTYLLDPPSFGNTDKLFKAKNLVSTLFGNLSAHTYLRRVTWYLLIARLMWQRIARIGFGINEG